MQELMPARRRRRGALHVHGGASVAALILSVAAIAVAATTGPPSAAVAVKSAQTRAPAARSKPAAAAQRQPAPVTLADSTSSGSPSNASNYGHDAHLSVNPRTLELTLDVSLAQLTGISDDVGMSIGLSYSSADAISDADANRTRFGLPYGWKYNISYIEDRGTYQNLAIDGSQFYVLSGTFATAFTPLGASQSIPALTGLLQYNRADANLQPDSGTVTVGGIPSAGVLQNLDGTSRYFSATGLLLEQVGRFGDTIQYFYNGNGSVATVLPTAIIDSWGNTTSFSYQSDQVTITLPDGRTTSFIAPDQDTITQITDPMGMVTSPQWATTSCAHGHQMIQSLSSAAGGMSAVQYQCMKVCSTAPTSGTCTGSDVTTWPVVSTFYDCPDNPSGMPCPSGSATDYLTSQYTIGTSSNADNYTGYPLYSPYTNVASNPGADPVMASNDDAFTYSTVVSRLNSDGTLAYQVENDYDHLHLLTDTYASVEGSSGLTLSKQTSYCYPVTAASPGAGCPMSGSVYSNLPADYQSLVMMGSCVFSVDNSTDSSSARLSTVVQAYDNFGQLTHTQQYFGTSSTAVIDVCNRSTLLDPSPLTLVMDDYMQYDEPNGVDSDQYIPLGSGSGHYGLMTGHETFSYQEPQSSGTTSTTPVLVHLTCSTLTGDNTAISEAAVGLLPTSSTAPTTIGSISACSTTPPWDYTVAPPKLTTFTYDSHGRVLNRTTQWDGGSPPGGVTSTSDTLTYTLTATNPGEETCAGSNVLQTVLTDGQGNTTQSRECTLNDFPLSTTDANGNTTTYTHDLDGLTTQVTYPNGTYVSYAYYYQCPVAQDGQTSTCPSTSTALSNCPYDTQSPPRSCSVQTLNAGTNNSSYADGVLQATIKDGLGRAVEVVDNLGGASGSGYTALETRSTTTYDSLGLEISSTEQIGASSPLIYTTTTSYDPKLRPESVCAPRGMSTQFVRDDVGQQVLALSNGTQRELVAYNDAQMATTTTDCPLLAGTTTSSEGSCPTVAISTSSAVCSGNGYYSYTMHDGSGLEYSTTATGSGTEQGASILSVTGTPTYSADSLIYGYSMSTVPSTGTSGTLSATASWTRDLQGLPLTMGLSVNASGNTTTFNSDTYTYNDISETLTETNKLSQSGGTTLAEQYAYTPVRLVSQRTNYDGRVHNYYYDNMNRLLRYCYPSQTSGVEGENFTYDSITGSVLSVTHFTNPGSCSACTNGNCGDVPGDSITYTYTRFGAIASKTYSNGGALSWAYDSYQRPSCFADAQATNGGNTCPSSPADGFSPAANQLLTSIVYWPDSDTYRRGFLQSTCRGVADGNGGYVTKCIDNDYYTAVDEGGSCDPALATVVGAYAGASKTTMLCTGGSCLTDDGTPVYTTTYFYDDFGRQCTVTSVNASNALILESNFTYDQFDNLVDEMSASDLDTSTNSNYQTAYTYDGLMRLATMTRDDLMGNMIESIAYTYDAASNITQKVQSVVVTPTTAPTAATPTSTSTPTLTSPTTTVQPPQICAGDCNLDGRVAINEIISLVNVALGQAALTCSSADLNHNGMIEMNELVTVINNALDGC